MRTHVRVFAGIGVVLALGIALLCSPRQGTAADDEEAKKAKAAADAILKLADALEKGDADALKKGTAELQKMELASIMSAFRKRDADPPGLGFGAKGQYPENLDGIEAMFMFGLRKELTGD